MPTPNISGAELKLWRSSRNLSLREMADMLGVNSPSTVNLWEGGQEIPGPADKLLRWLIRGEVPFDATAGAAEALKNAMWRVKMDLEAWEQLEEMRISEGYASMTDFIAGLIQEELRSSQEAAQRGDLGLAAEDGRPYVAGGNVSFAGTPLSEKLVDAARQYVTENPLADELAGVTPPPPQEQEQQAEPDAAIPKWNASTRYTLPARRGKGKSAPAP